MTARRRRHPGSKELVALTRGGQERSSAREAPKGANHATRVPKETIRDRSGKAEEAPRRVRAGEGRNKYERTSESSSIARQQDANADRQSRSPTRSIPALPPGRGIARTVTKALGASSNALWHEGFRRAAVRRGSSVSGEANVAEKHASLATTAQADDVNGAHGQVTDPIGCSFEVVGL
jgi:hypothetical protein